MPDVYVTNLLLRYTGLYLCPTTSQSSVASQLMVAHGTLRGMMML